MDPAVLEYALWNMDVHSGQDRLVLLAIARWRRIWDQVTPSMGYIAEETSSSKRTTQRVVQRLVDLGALVRTQRTGKRGESLTPAYDINVCRCLELVPDGKRGPLSALMRGGCQSGTGGMTLSHGGGATQSPKTKNKRDKQEQESKQSAEQIYSAYPRKVGRAVAIKEIMKAISRVAKSHKCSNAEAAGWLLGQTQKFASSYAGNRGEFTPHPRTFFHHERYTDDPDTWNNGENNTLDRGRNIDSTSDEAWASSE